MAVRLQNQLRLKDHNYVIVIFALLASLTTPLAAQAPEKAPELPATNRTAILEIQVRITRAQLEYFQHQTRMRELEQQVQKDVDALQSATIEACKAAKADCDKTWSLDLQTLHFTRRAAQAADPPERKP